MAYTTGPFAVDQFQFIVSVPVSLLTAVAGGKFDLNRLAREELANRGYDQKGVWVGFTRARQSLEEWERTIVTRVEANEQMAARWSIAEDSPPWSMLSN